MAYTTSDLALLGRKLGAVDYKPDIYVKEIAQRCVGGHELHLQRNNIKVRTLPIFLFSTNVLICLFRYIMQDGPLNNIHLLVCYSGHNLNT